MRIIHRDIDSRSGSGSVKLQPESAEDIWHLYNIICSSKTTKRTSNNNVGGTSSSSTTSSGDGSQDRVTSSTVRKVVKELSSGASSSNRQATTITVAVEGMEYDSDKGSLRISGKNTVENEFIRMGQYHTVEIEVNRPLTIHKDFWDSIYLERINDSADVCKSAELAAVVMHSLGGSYVATLCIIGKALTINKARIERRAPKKGTIKGETGGATALSRFFDDIYDAFKLHVDFSVVKAVLVGSPGYLRDNFITHLVERAVRSEDAAMAGNRGKFISAHTTTGHRNAAIAEMLGDSATLTQLGDAQAADEIKALARFHKLLAEDTDRVCYSYKDVGLIDGSYGNIAELLVTDRLFKAADFNTRSAYVKLVESVKSKGGKVYIFSSMHVSGAKLDQYTGVAAILRFPVDLYLAQTEQEESLASINSTLKRETSSSSQSSAAKATKGSGSAASKGRRVIDGASDDDIIDLSAASISDSIHSSSLSGGSNVLVFSNASSDALQRFEKACIVGDLSFGQLLAYC